MKKKNNVNLQYESVGDYQEAVEKCVAVLKHSPSYILDENATKYVLVSAHEYFRDRASPSPISSSACKELNWTATPHKIMNNCSF